MNKHGYRFLVSWDLVDRQGMVDSLARFGTSEIHFIVFRYLYINAQWSNRKATQQIKMCDMLSFIFLSWAFYKGVICSEIVFVQDLVHWLSLTPMHSTQLQAAVRLSSKLPWCNRRSLMMLLSLPSLYSLGPTHRGCHGHSVSFHFLPSQGAGKDWSRIGQFPVSIFPRCFHLV